MACVYVDPSPDAAVSRNDVSSHDSTYLIILSDLSYNRTIFLTVDTINVYVGLAFRVSLDNSSRAKTSTCQESGSIPTAETRRKSIMPSSVHGLPRVLSLCLTTLKISLFSVLLSHDSPPQRFLSFLSTSSFFRSPLAYTHAPAAELAKPMPIAVPRTRPRAVNLLRRGWRRRRARRA